MSSWIAVAFTVGTAFGGGLAFYSAKQRVQRLHRAIHRANARGCMRMGPERDEVFLALMALEAGEKEAVEALQEARDE